MGQPVTGRRWKDRIILAMCVAVMVVLIGGRLPDSWGWVIGRDSDGSSDVAAVASTGPVGAPDGVVVPSVAIDAPVVPIEMDAAGVLTPPADVAVTGWWQRSAQPGAETGQTLITGHSVHRGGGVMDRLGEVKAGDEVQVRAAGSTFTYRTTQVQELTKDQLAAQAPDLFGQDQHPRRLVLVTCSGWNGSGYDSNIVLFAEPA